MFTDEEIALILALRRIETDARSGIIKFIMSQAERLTPILRRTTLTVVLQSDSGQRFASASDHKTRAPSDAIHLSIAHTRTTV